MPVRQIKATYSSLTGRFASRKMNRLISWESALERDFYYLAEYDPSVATIEEQPITFSSKSRKYTPDALIELNAPSHIFPRLKVGFNIIEIKYRADLSKNWHKYRPKLKLAVGECIERKWNFKILTDVEIRSEMLENVKMIEHHMRRESEKENELRNLLIEQLSQLGTCDIDSLLNACFRSKSNQLKAIPVLWRLIGDHSIGVELTRPIGRKSDVWLMT